MFAEQNNSSLKEKAPEHMPRVLFIKNGENAWRPVLRKKYRSFRGFKNFR